MLTKSLVPLFGLAFCSVANLYALDNAPLISVTDPPYCSDISGNTEIKVQTTGLSTVTIKCWQQGTELGPDAITGKDSTVGTITPDPDGKGSIMFPADNYPHGPITVRLSGVSDKKAGAQDDGVIDNCYLQLYNKGGVSWNEGIPKKDPAAADGMKMVYSDDFSGPLSISSTDPKATYYDHKPPDGSQDFSSIRFTSFDDPNNPFSQVDTYLRIRADQKKNSTGLISSLKNDASGFKVSEPCYFECRMIAPNAKGTWPAFWLLTDYMTDLRSGKSDPSKEPVDELDIIEAVGGEGPGEPNGNGDPNNRDLYQITPHAWNQGDAGNTASGQAYKDMHNPAKMGRVGIPSSWYDTFHTYGCKITDTDTIYYCDNIEMGRHKTLDTSKKYPFFFLINLATGSGWPVDFSRYGGKVDMYVDWVRVYAQNDPTAATPPANP